MSSAAPPQSQLLPLLPRPSSPSGRSWNWNGQRGWGRGRARGTLTKGQSARRQSLAGAAAQDRSRPLERSIRYFRTDSGNSEHRQRDHRAPVEAIHNSSSWDRAPVLSGGLRGTSTITAGYAQARTHREPTYFLRETSLGQVNIWQCRQNALGQVPNRWVRKG